MVIRTFASFLIVMSVVAVPWQAEAQATDADRFSGIDLVCALDQSGSMWGNPKTHPGKNDPWQHRIGATKGIILRLIAHVRGVPFVHQVSVIDFADRAEVALSNARIAVGAGGSDAMEQLKARLETAVTAKDWGNTNTASALESAIGEFSKMKATAPAPGRRRIFLLITDGRPTMPGIPGDRLRADIRTHVDTLKKEGVEAWVVGLNDADSYWTESEGEFWEDLTGRGQGRARLAESASTTLSSVFQDVVDEWLGVRSTNVSGDTYECPPYLRRLEFFVTFSRPRGDVRIVAPDGRDLSRTAGGPAVSPGTFAQFAVDDPQPGTYRIIRETTRAATVQVEEYSPAVTRLAPAGEVDRGVESRLVFQARDAAGRPLALFDAFPITSTIVITPAGGAPQTVPATWSGEGRFEARWRPPAQGTYKLRLQGLVRRSNGSDFDVFGRTAHAYDEVLRVGTRQPYALRLDAPDPVAGLRTPPWTSSVEVRFVLTDQADQPVRTFTNLVRDPSTWLAVQPIDRAGRPGSAVPLVPGAGGVFTARTPLGLRWMRGEGSWWPGQVAWRVVARPDRLGRTHYLSGIKLPPGREDRRIDGDPFTAGSFDVRAPWWLWATAATLALVLAAAFAWVVMMRWLPGFLVRREDRAKRRVVEVKVYDEYRDAGGLSSPALPASGASKFNYDKRVSVDVDGTSKVIDRFRLTRQVSSGKAMATLEYQWAGEPRPHRLQLTSNAPRPLAQAGGGSYVVMLTERAS